MITFSWSDQRYVNIKHARHICIINIQHLVKPIMFCVMSLRNIMAFPEILLHPLACSSLRNSIQIRLTFSLDLQNCQTNTSFSLSLHCSGLAIYFSLDLQNCQTNTSFSLSLHCPGWAIYKNLQFRHPKQSNCQMLQICPP